MHKLRRAMVRPDRDRLGGPDVSVEIDQTFIGGRTQGRGGLRYANKSEVVIAVERQHPRGLGRARLGGSIPRCGAMSSTTSSPATSPPARSSTATAIPPTAEHPAATPAPRTDRPAELTESRPRAPPRRPPGRLTAQAVARRNPPRRPIRRPPRLLPRRVHVPLQPTHQPLTRPAVVPTRPTSREHRPPPLRRAHPQDVDELESTPYATHTFQKLTSIWFIHRCDATATDSCKDVEREHCIDGGRDGRPARRRPVRRRRAAAGRVLGREPSRAFGAPVAGHAAHPLGRCAAANAVEPERAGAGPGIRRRRPRRRR